MDRKAVKAERKEIFELMTDPQIFLQIAGIGDVYVHRHSKVYKVIRPLLAPSNIVVEVRDYCPVGQVTIAPRSYTFEIWRIHQKMTSLGVIDDRQKW